VLLALAPHAPSFVRRLTSAIVEDITEFSELLENALSTRDAAVVEVPDRFRPLVDVTLNHGKFV
jgi:hypothetical protein